MDFEQLRNTGVLELNKPSTKTAEKTVIVLGSARGGTSMVAGVLQALGVFMGEKLGPVFEDVVLSGAIEARNFQLTREIVQNRNQAYPVWGWKRPSAIQYRDVWSGLFRNPYIIAIFRDPFAIANRNRISMLSDIFQNMESSVDHLNTMISFLRNWDGPILLTSYEKALLSPVDFVDAIDQFLELNVPDLKVNALNQIKPASKAYLDNSRITQSKGCLDEVNADFCSGWAFYQKQPNRIANVQIYINEMLRYSVKAKLMRGSVKDIGIHPTGECGFKFYWPQEAKPKQGDVISVKVEGDIQQLHGSPTTLIL